FPYPREISRMDQLQRVDGLLRKPCRVLQRLANILWLQIRIVLKNLGYGHPVGYQIHNQGDRDSHAAEACTSAHYMGIKGNSVKSQHGNPPFCSHPPWLLRLPNRQTYYARFLSQRISCSFGSRDIMTSDSGRLTPDVTRRR